MRVKRDGGPAGLGAEGAKWWAALNEQFHSPEPSTRLRMEVCCRAADRLAEAREAIRVNGMVHIDRYNQMRPNPACGIEDKSRSTILAALRDLERLSKRDGIDADLAAFIEEVTF